MADHSKCEVLKVHLLGAVLSILLFAMHTAILFAIASGLKSFASISGAMMHPKLVGPVLILSCFVVLFATHLLEGVLWATFLWRKKLMVDFGEAVYFSLTSFSAVGYGDVVLRTPWRPIGAVMAVNGLLLFGCSTAFLFVVMQRTWVVME